MIMIHEQIHNSWKAKQSKGGQSPHAEKKKGPHAFRCSHGRTWVREVVTETSKDGTNKFADCCNEKCME